MKYKMSPNVAIATAEVEAAVEFYTKVLGFARREDGPDYIDLDAEPINLFISEDPELTGPVMELFVDDLETARDELLAHGCKIIRWRGKGQDCYLQDPFGLRFNLWQID
jgi:catechol 2,3-dioxygenase-like lactoylglutathione lyase family enzyme